MRNASKATLPADFICLCPRDFPARVQGCSRRYFGLLGAVSPKKPRIEETKIARPCSIPKKKVVGPQKTKISSPENQDFKMADPFPPPHTPACGRLVVDNY